MTNDTIFITQLGSIIGFLIVLFVLYRVLVSQKDATIQLLKEKITDLKEKLQEALKSNPDALSEALNKRIEIYEAEIKRLEKDEIANESEIAKIEDKLKNARKDSVELKTIIQQIKGIQYEIKNIRYEQSIDEDYIKSMYGYVDNEIVEHLVQTKKAYSIPELSDILNLDPFIVEFRLNELIHNDRVEKICESPNTTKYRMILRS